MTRIIAHRGASAYAPENTMAAFELAVEMGIRALELDVAMTADGVLVVLHDIRVERTSNGVGKISDFRLEDVRRLSFDRGFEGAFPPESLRIPTLAEVLDFGAREGLWVNVETKDFSDDWPEINNRVAELVRKHDAVEQVLVSSGNHSAMAGLAREHPEIRTAIAFTETLANLREYAAGCGASTLHPNSGLVDAEFVIEAHEAGLEVNVWTVDDPAEAEAVIGLGIDGLMTNRPDLMPDAESREAR